MMKRIDFQALLADFYQLYNPSKINEVNNLVERYQGQELDAIRMAYIKYNYKSHPFYNPNVTEEFLEKLIESYNQKDRVLSKENVERAQQEKNTLKDPSQEEKEKLEKTLLSTQKEIENIKNSSEEKLREMVKILSVSKEESEREIKKLKEILEAKEKNEPYLPFDVKINMFYTDSEVEIPSKELFAYIGKGAKIICMDKNNKIIGLSVEDVILDFISDPTKTGKPTLEITIDKVKL